MVVIIKTNDDNWETREAYTAKGIESAKDFICGECDITPVELKEYKVDTMDRDCVCYDVEGLVYHIYVNPGSC